MELNFKYLDNGGPKLIFLKSPQLKKKQKTDVNLETKKGKWVKGRIKKVQRGFLCG